MQIASSAICTCIEFASASEYTATLRTFSSLHARIMRTAISPRFATRIFSNMSVGRARRFSAPFESPLRRSNLEHRLAELHRLGVIHQDRTDHTLRLGFDLIHHLHRLYDANHR